MAVSSRVLLESSNGKAKVAGISLDVEGCIRVKVDGWEDVKEPLDDAAGASCVF